MHYIEKIVLFEDLETNALQVGYVQGSPEEARAIRRGGGEARSVLGKNGG